YENRMCVDLYVEHHDYDVLDFLLEETSDPELISASSDEYCSDDESEDIDVASIVEAHFEAQMEQIKEINPEAYEYLVQKKPNSWCRAFFNPEVKCPAFKNEICESHHIAIIV
ncbi:hypothetical protein Tco_0912388, partial [Tanacetum coccineum]